MKSQCRLSALLLALCSCGHKEASAPNRPEPLFREAAGETGLRFQHDTGATGKYFMPEIMGSGAALLDYDGDGDLDVYLVQGAPLEPGKRPVGAPPGQPPGSRLFRNELAPSGRLRFTDVTEKAGVGFTGYGMGAAAGDYDNDGHVDLYVTAFGRNVLYRNNGDGTFADVTDAAGAGDSRWSTSASFVDYDRDGDLDLFVLNYVDFTIRGNKKCFAPTGEIDYCTPKAYRALPSSLFRNDGNGRFTNVTAPARIGAEYGPGLGIVASDFDEDGWLDVYVANDTAANILWLNQHDGTFHNGALMAGAALSADGLPKAGMGVAAGDYDRDGFEDLIVLNLRREGCTLFRGLGKGQFEDLTLRSGLGSITYQYTGFGVDWFDYDNDGYLDLFLANGAVTVLEAQRGRPHPFAQRNLLLHNEAGRAFTNVTDAAGPAFELIETSRAAVFGDIDNDGDIDILVTNNGGFARLLLNQAASNRNWLAVRLVGSSDNRMGLGAAITVSWPGAKPLRGRVHSDSSYLSANDSRVFFGLADRREAVRVEVVWPSGKREDWEKIAVNQLVTLRQGSGLPH